MAVLAGVLFATAGASASPGADSTGAVPDSIAVTADSIGAVRDSTSVPTVLTSAAPDSTRAAADSARAAAVSDSVRTAAYADSVRMAAAADSARTAATTSWISVTTKPPGLRVRIGEQEAGSSPIEGFPLDSARVKVTAFPLEPRIFESAPAESVVDARPGETIHLEFDLRPNAVVQSLPISSVSRVAWEESRPDSFLGSTPIRLPISLLESNSIRLTASGFADSIVLGPKLLAQTGGGVRKANIVLRPVALVSSAPPPSPPLFKRKWFAWTLVGVGALMTGGAVILRDEADRSYERYLDATDPHVIEEAYDRTVQFDRYAVGALGGGQVLFTTGLLLLITGTAK